ncbi:MAG: hypothetical protein DCC49_13590 [Acidobacteria bacterium]|nr:MAG: hypothetical protein DCC49_13590 [Acidobacteriota bacterium]
MMCYRVPESKRFRRAAIALGVALGLLLGGCGLETSPPLPTSLAWSADDSQLMYLSLSGTYLTGVTSQLRLWTEASGKSKTVVSLSGQIDNFAWASERGLVAYSIRSEGRNEVNGSRVVVLRIADRREVARFDMEIEDPSYPLHVSWSADESWLAMEATNQGRRIRLIHDSEYGDPRYIAASGTSGIAWDTESARLSYVSNGRIYVANPASLEVTEVATADQAIGPVGGPPFRPGFDEVAFTASHFVAPGDYTTRLAVSNLASGEVETLVERKDGPIPEAGWSHDGLRLAFTAYDGLDCAQSEREHVGESLPEFSQAKINGLLPLTKGPGPTTCILEGGQARPLVREPDGYASSFAWSNRSARIAYSGKPDSQSEEGIYVLDPVSNELQRIV